MAYEFEVFGKIARPVAAVFNAVTDPGELSSYFTTGGASGPLREGTTVQWSFADFPGKFPVKVTKLVPNERIEFSWMQMLCCLKAWVEHRINLRDGFF